MKFTSTCQSESCLFVYGISIFSDTYSISCLVENQALNSDNTLPRKELVNIFKTLFCQLL